MARKCFAFHCQTNYCGLSEILNKGSVENKEGNV
jgi:hypothetical protein